MCKTIHSFFLYNITDEFSVRVTQATPEAPSTAAGAIVTGGDAHASKSTSGLTIGLGIAIK